MTDFERWHAEEFQHLLETVVVPPEQLSQPQDGTPS